MGRRNEKLYNAALETKTAISRLIEYCDMEDEFPSMLAAIADIAYGNIQPDDFIKKAITVEKWVGDVFVSYSSYDVYRIHKYIKDPKKFLHVMRDISPTNATKDGFQMPKTVDVVNSLAKYKEDETLRKIEYTMKGKMVFEESGESWWDSDEHILLDFSKLNDPDAKYSHTNYGYKTR